MAIFSLTVRYVCTYVEWILKQKHINSFYVYFLWNNIKKY